MIQIKLPATSANLGAGFDSLGVAVDLYNEVHMEEADEIRIVAADGADIPTGSDNLIYKTARYLYDLCGKTLHGLSVTQINNIPMARGLGSSSACILGGLIGANSLMGNPVEKSAILDMAATLEKHPDNVAPALLGGMVTAVIEDKKVYYVKQPLRDDIRFVAFIPDFELKTSLAREALPRDVAHKDAAYNLSRAALMAASLCSGAYGNLRVASGDSLHQPYRIGLIRGGQSVIAACYELGAHAAYISGAGSTLMAIVPAAGAEEFVSRAGRWISGIGLDGWRILLLEGDNDGTQIFS